MGLEALFMHEGHRVYIWLEGLVFSSGFRVLGAGV